MVSMPGSWDAPTDQPHPASSFGQPHPLEYQDAHTYLANQMLLRRTEYLGPKKISIKVGSWNVGNFSCHEDLKDWFPENTHEYGIYVLGLQEVVDVNQTSSFLKYMDPKIALNWKAHVQAALPAGYECVASPQLIGMLLLVYVAPELAAETSSVSMSTVGTGLMGYVGNKGGVGVRLVLGDTLRLSFINCHLAAFANAVERRNWDSGEILRRISFEAVDRDVVGLEAEGTAGEPAAEGLDKTDVLIWCGDLNYRVDLENNDVRALLQPYMPKDLPPTHADISSPIMSPKMGSPDWDFPKLPPTPTEAHPNATTTLNGTIESLLKHDQLLKQKREGKAFSGFKEGKIAFLPTYKYDMGTVGIWDSSEKARAPSWCDRILWRVKESSNQENNGEVEEEKRARSYSVTSDELAYALKDEVLFETADNSDSDEDDLIVSRGESPIPRSKPLADWAPLPLYDDPKSIVETPFGAVRLEQNSYTSYQNVTASDHKPISATFALSYPAADPDRRAKVQAEVVREVDKLENERRPVVTVIIDHPEPSPEGEDVVNFGDVRFWERKYRNVTVANTGTSKAKIHFVRRPKPDGDEGEVICKSWIAAEFSDQKNKTELEPGEVVNISITLLVETVQQVLDLNDRLEVLDDVLVLRVEGGRDVFLPISAKWLYSSYGTTLKELIKIPENVGGFRGYMISEENKKAPDGPLYSAPREIYRITQFLCDSLADVVSTLGPEEKIEDKLWFSRLGWPFLKETYMNTEEERRRKIEVGIWEALDTDSEFEDSKCSRVVMDEEDEDAQKEELVEAAAAVFLRWLEGLREGIIPESLWEEVVKAGGDAKMSEQVLDRLPEKAGQVHANVFIYLVGFVAETVTILVAKREGDKTQEVERLLGKILEPVARALVRKPTKAVGGKAGAREEEARKGLVRKFVEM